MAWWTQRDGKRIRVADMTDDHVRNAVALQCRRGLMDEIDCAGRSPAGLRERLVEHCLVADELRRDDDLRAVYADVFSDMMYGSP